MYSQKVLAQFQNERFVGELPDATAYVQTTDPVCGDVLRLSLKIIDGRIAAVRFRARGCVAAVACGAQVCEMLVDRPATEAARITVEQLVSALDGLPPASMHAAQLAVGSVRTALRDVRSNAAVAGKR